MNRRMRIAAAVAIAALGFAGGVAEPAVAVEPAVADGVFPTTLSLPDGFPPEGIAIGPGPFAYFGSRADGSIFQADLITGGGRIISPGPGTQSLGMKTDPHHRLFVAGGSAGNARVIDVRTGDVLASYQFATAPTFVNDVILTPHAAWFTDSSRLVLYQLPLGPAGELPAADGVVRVPLTGEIVLGAGTNANGIALTPDQQGLLIIQSNTGLLFRVDPATGVTVKVDLGGELLTAGDGLLLIGQTLFVVQNRLNQVAVVELAPSGLSGVVVDRVTDPRFDIPTTVAAFGDRLYLPNARFTTPVTPTTPYTAVAIPRP
jgi:sugar lactone lactonase YvrE